MCYAAPGPRCGPHAKTQWSRSSEKLASLQAQDSALTEEITKALESDSYADEESLDSLRQKQQVLRDKIDAQMDKVISDRDGYRATSAGVKELSEELSNAIAKKDVRKVATVQKAYDRASQEYTHRLFAARILSYQKDNLQKMHPGQDVSEINKELNAQYRQLREKETEANRRYVFITNQAEMNSASSTVQKQMQLSRQEASRAKEARLAFERRVSTSKSGHFGKFTGIKADQMNQHNLVYLNLKPQDFGVARNYFPHGALVRVDSVRIGDNGQRLAKLATGDERPLYSDESLYAAA